MAVRLIEEMLSLFAIFSIRTSCSFFLNSGSVSVQHLVGSLFMNLGFTSCTISCLQLFQLCGMLYLMQSISKMIYLLILNISRLAWKIWILESTDSGAGSSMALVKHWCFKSSPLLPWRDLIQSMIIKVSPAHYGSQVLTFMAWLLSWQTSRFGVQQVTTLFTQILWSSVQ